MIKVLRNIWQVGEVSLHSLYESATFRNSLNSPTSCFTKASKISLGLYLSGLLVSSLILTPQTHVRAFPSTSTKNQRNMLQKNQAPTAEEITELQFENQILRQTVERLIKQNTALKNAVLLKGKVVEMPLFNYKTKMA